MWLWIIGIVIGVYELIAIIFACCVLYTAPSIRFWEAFLFAQGWIILVLKRIIGS